MSVAQGFRAAVGSTYNYAAPIYDRVREAVNSGDLEEAQIVAGPCAGDDRRDVWNLWSGFTESDDADGGD